MSVSEQYLFMPRQYQCLYCITVLPDTEMTAEDMGEVMGVSPKTVYKNINALRNRGLLDGDKNTFVLTRKGLKITKLDHDTLDSLIFWFRACLGYDEAAARKNALSVLFRTPIEAARRMAKFGSLHKLMRMAGGRAEEPLGLLPPGRYDAPVSVFFETGNKCVKLYGPPATLIADGEGECVLELRAGHIRRIAFADGRRRGPSPTLWYFAGNDFIPARETAERWHISGDALRPEPSEEGDIAARVRVRVTVNSHHAPTEAELVLRISREPEKTHDIFLRSH
jgi:Mn-dependent DtxR family transcriptional regulator